MTDATDAAQPVSGLSDDDAAEVRSTVEEWTSYLGHDWDRWISYYDDEAVVIVPGEHRLSGHDSIARYMHANFGDVDRIGFEHWSIDGAGDLAVVNNDVIWRNAGESEDQTAKQIVVLRRHAPGRWIVHQVAVSSPGR